VTIVDQFQTTAVAPRPFEAPQQDPVESDSVEGHIMRLIEEDPFMTIGEIKQDLAHLVRGRKVGWWRIFLTLRRRKLLTRRSRFDYVRRRR